VTVSGTAADSGRVMSAVVPA